MEKTHLPIAILSIIVLANAITGGSFPFNVQRNSTIRWPIESTEEQISSEGASESVYIATYFWSPANGNKFYGVEATLDVYGFPLGNDQVSQASIWIIDRGDGQPSSLSGVQAGWNISPADYKDSKTHFYVEWTVAGPDKDCLNMECPGFHKTSTSITPGDIINPVSSYVRKQYITLRLFKDKSTGDWHIHYGFNGAPQPVGYLPKSLLPGLIDKPVEIRFGGLVSHRKPQPSPPMGNGYLPATTAAASFSDLKVIDENGNKFAVNINLPVRISLTKCYFLSGIDMKKSRFFYGGAGCDD